MALADSSKRTIEGWPLIWVDIENHGLPLGAAGASVFTRLETGSGVVV